MSERPGERILSTPRFSRAIVVVCHAIPLCERREQVYLSEWWVGTYPGYRYDDEICLYIEHIREGIKLASEDPSAMLCLSGGYTKDLSVFRGHKVISEAQGYWNVAEYCGWFNCPEVRERAFKEEYARDSYENLEFSTKLFRALTGRPAERVTVVGIRIKQRRFELHADWLRRRSDVSPFRFEYIGVNDPPAYVLDAGSRLGEALTLRAFENDPHGDAPGGELEAKRLRRDPFSRGGYPGKPQQSLTLEE